MKGKGMRRIRMLLIILATALLAGCTNDRVTAPSSSSITVSPAAVTVTACAFPAWHTQYYTITVLDSNGIPMNNVDVTLSFLWASPDTANLLRLYKGETFSTAPITVTTDDAGKYDLKTAMLVGCGEWGADLEVRSGAVFGSARIDVKVP